MLAPPDAGHDDNFIVQVLLTISSEGLHPPHFLFHLYMHMKSMKRAIKISYSFIVLNPNMQPLVMHSYIASFWGAVPNKSAYSYSYTF